MENLTTVQIGGHYTLAIAANQGIAWLGDHSGGWLNDGSAPWIEEAITVALSHGCNTLHIAHIGATSNRIKLVYNQRLIGCLGWEYIANLEHQFTITSNIEYKFCSFNGSSYPGRHLLVAYLYYKNMFNIQSMTKNFVTTDEVIGILDEYKCGAQLEVTKRFFMDQDSFSSCVFQIDEFDKLRYNHRSNYHSLANTINKSFVNIICETNPTMARPFITEKCLYSIASKGLFLMYAQPAWYKYFTVYLGFKLYDNIFDYSFDDILNPVDRMMTLVDMLEKFNRLPTDDLPYLHYLEQDAIEYNYEHYVSGRYKQSLIKKLGDRVVFS